MSGVRVALAGIPDSASLELGPDTELAINTVAQLRDLIDLPHALEIVIPYRWFDASVVRVERAPNRSY